jgi:2-hydroxyacyl-CoA lyase 1
VLTAPAHAKGYNFPVNIVLLNNGGIGPGMPKIPENPMFNMKPNPLIYGARYDHMMEAFGGKGFLSRTRRT